MTAPFSPRGAYTALATPFSSDGSLDLPRFEELVRFQLDQGIDGIVPCGTTGESPTLEWEEHDALVEAAVRVAGGRQPILAGTGSNSTSEAIHATKSARELGADAVLLVDCYYNGPSSLELREEYYERVLDAVADVPVVPYVIPGRTGCALSAEDLAILHLDDPVRVPAVKQATGDLARMRADRALAGRALAILSGDDDLTLAMMRDQAIAASGVISVMSNLAPAAVAAMTRAAAEGRHDEADRLAKVLAPIFRLVTCSTEGSRDLPNGARVPAVDKFRNPVPAKTMMAGLGMLPIVMRPPLGKMTKTAVAICRAALEELHRADPSVLTPIEAAFDVSIDERLRDDAIWSALVR
jgi:4-hydroxy-tetrahydrodipicolinate synthase